MNDHQVARAARRRCPGAACADSGIGRARGASPCARASSHKVVTWDPPVGLNAWWFPYDAALARAPTRSPAALGAATRTASAR